MFSPSIIECMTHVHAFSRFAPFDVPALLCYDLLIWLFKVDAIFHRSVFTYLSIEILILVVDNVLATAFTQCDKSCGGGIRLRMIKVNNRQVLQRRSCNMQSCPSKQNILVI